MGHPTLPPPLLPRPFCPPPRLLSSVSRPASRPAPPPAPPHTRARSYAASRALGLSERICRTNSIEVGMQNSTLGAVLAALHFADPLTAAPCAVSACTHSVMGSLLAAYWRAQDDAAERRRRG